MKIAICTPHYADVHPHFAYSLARMMVHTVQAPIMFNEKETVPELEIFMLSSSTLPTLRNLLVKRAADWGANYLLWADADHSFPPGALLRLLSLNLPVVGVNYPRRTFPTSPTAGTLDGEILWTTEEMARNGEVTQVGSIGLGFCLMDMTIFNSLHARALAAGKENFWPLFAYEILPGQIEGVGDDIYFFNRLQEAGIGIYVDHALSWSIAHAHQKMLTNSDALLQKDAFLAKRSEERAGPHKSPLG